MSKSFLYTVIAVILIGFGAFYITSEKEKDSLRADLNRVQAELRDTQTELRLAKEQANKKPQIPIELSKRDALLDGSEVVQLKNIGTRNLTVLVQCKRPGIGDQKSFSVDLIPNQPREIGHMEGWAFKAGDEITVSHPDFTSIERSIN